MPFLAATLLFMNRRVDWVGTRLRSGTAATLMMVACLVLFGWLLTLELLGFLG